MKGEGCPSPDWWALALTALLNHLGGDSRTTIRASLDETLTASAGVITASVRKARLEDRVVESTDLIVGVILDVLHALDDAAQCAGSVEVLLCVVLYNRLKGVESAVDVTD
jgi:predicted amino acid racemase